MSKTFLYQVSIQIYIMVYLVKYGNLIHVEELVKTQYSNIILIFDIKENE